MISPPELSLHAAALTHVGKRRTRNEDCIAIAGERLNEAMPEPRQVARGLESPCVCLVADGMGGHPAGDVASRLVAGHLLGSIDASVTSEHALVDAVCDAHRLLFDEMKRVPACYGMGTTVAGLVAHADGILAFNVGDSRVYRIRGGRLEQLSVDDSMESRSSLLFNGTRGRVLSQCLGGFLDGEPMQPHVLRLPLEAGAEFLVCSDGLHDMLADSEIERCLEADLAASVKALFEHAMDEGGIDNISIIQARILPRTAPAAARP